MLAWMWKGVLIICSALGFTLWCVCVCVAVKWSTSIQILHAFISNNSFHFHIVFKDLTQRLRRAFRSLKSWAAFCTLLWPAMSCHAVTGPSPWARTQTVVKYFQNFTNIFPTTINSPISCARKKASEILSYVT